MVRRRRRRDRGTVKADMADRAGITFAGDVHRMGFDGRREIVAEVAPAEIYRPVIVQGTVKSINIVLNGNPRMARIAIEFLSRIMGPVIRRRRMADNAFDRAEVMVLYECRDRGWA